MLILLQHNAAHLGIATGLCLSEACAKHFRPWVSTVLLLSAVGASISTALAEILGGAIGLNMLFGLPLNMGAVLTCGFVFYMLFSNSYRRLEKWILAFVSLIGLAFLLELSLVADLELPPGVKARSAPPGDLRAPHEFFFKLSTVYVFVYNHAGVRTHFELEDARRKPLAQQLIGGGIVKGQTFEFELFSPRRFDDGVDLTNIRKKIGLIVW
jgi:hypothetical protein